jgi:hypothetical protein
MSDLPPTFDDVDRWWRGVLDGDISRAEAGAWARSWLGFVPDVEHNALYTLHELESRSGTGEEVLVFARERYARWCHLRLEFEADLVVWNRERFRALLRFMLTRRSAESVRATAETILANNHWPDATADDVDEVLGPPPA